MTSDEINWQSWFILRPDYSQCRRNYEPLASNVCSL